MKRPTLGAEARRYAWQAQRALVDRAHLTAPFTPGGGRRVLIISAPNTIAGAQVFPFFYYQRALADRCGVQLRELALKSFMQGRCPWIGKVDVVALQTWFDVPADEMARIFARIRERCAPERTIFMDSFAPTDLRLAESVDPHVDLYVTKHLMRDRGYYGQETFGHTNLMEYYGRRFELDREPTLWSIPDGFMDKVVLGPSFAAAPYMLPRFESNAPMSTPKRIDMHARLGAKGTGWYSAMRQEAVDAIDTLSGLEVASGFGVTRKEFMRELSASRMCFSPFGYGEVCWRDYEAVMCGALLIKPDMSHIETDPDIFTAGETYVPVKWDLSDFADKAHYYATHHEEREAICERAFARLHAYFKSGRCVQRLAYHLTGEA